MTTPNTENRMEQPERPASPGRRLALDPRVRAVIERAPPLRSALLDEIRDLLPPPGRRHGGQAGDDAA